MPFRAPDLAATRRYWGAMLGLGSADGATGLVSGAIGNPHLMGSLVLAAAVAFFGVQSWDFTRRLTPVRAALAMALFVVALGMLVATSFHPFIYFIF